MRIKVMVEEVAYREPAVVGDELDHLVLGLLRHLSEVGVALLHLHRIAHVVHHFSTVIVELIGEAEVLRRRTELCLLFGWSSSFFG